jgi:hypothetical protein
MSVPDDGYYVPDDGYYVPDEGYYVPDDGYTYLMTVILETHRAH